MKKNNNKSIINQETNFKILHRIQLFTITGSDFKNTHEEKTAVLSTFLVINRIRQVQSIQRNNNCNGQLFGLLKDLLLL